jgi:hypothetical protein
VLVRGDCATPSRFGGLETLQLRPARRTKASVAPSLRVASYMPKKQIAIFVVIDLILVVAVLIAVFHHVKILYVLLAFTLLSVINGIFLIVTVVKRTGSS